MDRQSPLSRLVSCLAAGLLIAGCGLGKPSGPKREEVLPLLQKEADALKRDGEKINPELGIQSTWQVVSVDAREQPTNADQPWVGTIRFNVTSKMKEVDGTDLTQQFEKKFEYVWNNTLKGWVIQYTPQAPTTPQK